MKGFFLKQLYLIVSFFFREYNVYTFSASIHTKLSMQNYILHVHISKVCPNKENKAFNGICVHSFYTKNSILGECMCGCVKSCILKKTSN